MNYISPVMLLLILVPICSVLSQGFTEDEKTKLERDVEKAIINYNRFHSFVVKSLKDLGGDDDDVNTKLAQAVQSGTPEGNTTHTTEFPAAGKLLRIVTDSKPLTTSASINGTTKVRKRRTRTKTTPVTSTTTSYLIMDNATYEYPGEKKLTQVSSILPRVLQILSVMPEEYFSHIVAILDGIVAEAEMTYRLEPLGQSLTESLKTAVKALMLVPVSILKAAAGALSKQLDDGESVPEDLKDVISLLDDTFTEEEGFRLYVFQKDLAAFPNISSTDYEFVNRTFYGLILQPFSRIDGNNKKMLINHLGKITAIIESSGLAGRKFVIKYTQKRRTTTGLRNNLPMRPKINLNRNNIETFDYTRKNPNDVKWYFITERLKQKCTLKKYTNQKYIELTKKMELEDSAHGSSAEDKSHNYFDQKYDKSKLSLMPVIHVQHDEVMVSKIYKSGKNIRKAKRNRNKTTTRNNERIHRKLKPNTKPIEKFKNKKHKTDTKDSADQYSADEIIFKSKLNQAAVKNKNEVDVKNNSHRILRFNEATHANIKVIIETPSPRTIAEKRISFLEKDDESYSENEDIFRKRIQGVFRESLVDTAI